MITPSGGPQDRGRPYIIGKRGSEMFVPKVAGRIVSAERVGEAMAQGISDACLTGSQAELSRAIRHEIGKSFRLRVWRISLIVRWHPRKDQP